MAFEQKLKAYEVWKNGLRDNLRAYRDWLEANDMAQPDAIRRIEQALESLREDRLRVAFVAEFSRGKTELINAMFFSNYGRRLLPSSAGRTTMCPVELFYDQDLDEAYLRLLPVETRLETATLSQLKEDPRKWVHYPLALHSPEQIEQILCELVKTKKVTVEEAGRLGLFDHDLHAFKDDPPSEIEIPRWRHALVSFPHPLLEQGLVLIDTPGLNALGTEPELTLDMLPSSQGVIFVLAADTGVTRSDLEMWHNHLRSFQHSHKRGAVVALNKIDTLWDEIKNPEDIAAAISSQRSSVAKVLGVKEDAVFPVSAQKGLLAKLRSDTDLLERSGMIELERYLSDDILSSKHEIVTETITGEIGAMIERTRGILATRLAGIRNQREELAQLDGQSADMLKSLTEKAKLGMRRYEITSENFRTSRALLEKQGVEMLAALEPVELEVMIETAYEKMKGNWTTAGMKESMQELFDALRARMRQVTQASEEARKLVRTVYARFQTEHGFKKIQPPLLSLMKHQVSMELFYQEAEVFRKSASMALTEKHFVIKRFFSLIVDRAREVCGQTREETEQWTESALDPLRAQLRDHKETLARRLSDLKRIDRSKETLAQRLGQLDKDYKQLSRDLTRLRNLQFAITQSQPEESTRPPGPRLVSSRSATGNP